MNEAAIDLASEATSYTLLAAMFYVGVIAIMNVVAGLAVVFKRMTHKVSLGHGDNHELLRFTRLHGNLAENTSPTLGVLIGLGIMDVHFWWVHAVAISFIVGRAFHAYSLARTDVPLMPRQIGMMLTWNALIIGAVGLFIHTV